MLAKLGRDVEERSDQLGVLEALLVNDSANRKFMPTLLPIIDGWFSSNFGYRIDPFTGMQSFHEGIDFPADNGTPVVAAASGKVIESGYQPQYGKIVAIDHGNGLVSQVRPRVRGVCQRRRPRRARATGGVGGVDGPFDRSTPAFRGSAQWRTAESRAVSASPGLIRGDELAGQCRRHEG